MKKNHIVGDIYVWSKHLPRVVQCSRLITVTTSTTQHSLITPPLQRLKRKPSQVRGFIMAENFLDDLSHLSVKTRTQSHPNRSQDDRAAGLIAHLITCVKTLYTSTTRSCYSLFILLDDVITTPVNLLGRFANHFL